MKRDFYKRTFVIGVGLGISFGCSGTPASSTCEASAIGSSSSTTPCATGGSAATGGSSAGTTNTTGGATNTTGGATNTTGGSPATGGNQTAMGGSQSTGSFLNTGGTAASSTGGLASTGGTVAIGGSTSTGGASSTGGSSTVSATGTLGQPCSSPGQLACAGVDQRLGLVCGASNTWEVNQTCNQSLVCDARPGATAGTCQTPDADCIARGAGTNYCVGKQWWACDVWGIRASLQQDCAATGTCLNGSCFVYKPGTKSPGDPCTYAEYATSAKVCNAFNQKEVLKCGGSIWTTDGTCTSTDICDSPPGTTPGICHPPDTPCAGHAAGERFCSGDSQVWSCNSDGTVASWKETCGLLCFHGSCIAESSCPSADITESCSTNCPSQDANACVGSAGALKTVTICPTASGTQIATIHINPSELTVPSSCSTTTTRAFFLNIGGAGCPVQNVGSIKVKAWPYLNLNWRIAPDYLVRGSCTFAGGYPCYTTSGSGQLAVWSASGGPETNIVVEISDSTTLSCP